MRPFATLNWRRHAVTTIRRCVPIVLFLVFVTIPAHSETRYVKDEIQVMVRSDPGPKRKIVAMPTSGTRVEVLEKREDGWSRVRLPEGQEGWILEQYLVQGPPNKVIIAKLQQENDALKQQAERLRGENPVLKNELKDLQEALAEQTKNAEALSASYETLKTESSEFLALKAAHQKASKELAEKTKRQSELEEQVNDLQNTRTLRWFLAGGAVLFVGFVVGYMSRRPKRRPSLL